MKSKNTTTASIRTSTNRLPLKHGSPFIALALACFALSLGPKAFAADSNTAVGIGALCGNTTGTDNTGTGVDALTSNTSGISNTANGFEALAVNTTGASNTAVGDKALNSTTTGSRNIGLGAGAGSNVTTNSDNIEIGNSGVAGDSKTIRIGIQGTQSATLVAGIFGATVNMTTGTTVFVDSTGKLGTIVSSARFKRDIHSMDRASEEILALRPVTFRYKEALDPNGTAQFGLVAEEVEKIDPALVVRDAHGKPYSVRYEAVNAMLLNEFLKEHKKVEEQNREIQEQRATIAEMKKAIGTLTTAVKEQGAEIQKVGTQLEISKPQPQIASNDQ